MGTLHREHRAITSDGILLGEMRKNMNDKYLAFRTSYIFQYQTPKTLDFHPSFECRLLGKSTH